MDQLEYQPVVGCLRPPRVAVAYHAQSNWMHAARQAISSLCRIWGGAGATILPLEDHGAIPRCLLPLLRAYDPDGVAVHAMTVGDLAVADPRVIDRLVERFGLEGETRDATWARIADEPIRDRPSELAAEQIDGWCSPFKGLQQDATAFNRTQFNFLHRDGQPGGGLSLLPGVQDEVVYTLNLASVDPFLALAVESRVGALAQAARQDLHVIELPVLDEDLPALVGLAITGEVSPGGWGPAPSIPDGARTGGDRRATFCAHWGRLPCRHTIRPHASRVDQGRNSRTSVDRVRDRRYARGPCPWDAV